ncbi:MAG TPA: hypothetical protein VFB72_19215 [Verrucomicrobiae bacterium]|nr:hypothetical protein [Verrucomicrobiae bacterium]
MTAREKRTLRYATIFIAIYLALFAAFQVFKFGSQKRAEYNDLVARAAELKAEVKLYDDKIAVVQKLMEKYKMDPAKLNRSSLVGESSSAIQQAAMGSGFALGPIRETQTRASGKELATIQFEGSGPVKAAVGLMSRLETLGFPLVIDSAQISSDPMRPGMLKLKLTVIILDFEQWLKEEPSHA